MGGGRQRLRREPLPGQLPEHPHAPTQLTEGAEEGVDGLRVAALGSGGEGGRHGLGAEHVTRQLPLVLCTVAGEQSC